MRRIEAITGEGALQRFQNLQSELARVAGAVRASEAELVEHVEKLLAREKSLEHELQQLKNRMAQAEARELQSKATRTHTNGPDVMVLIESVSGFDRAQLRTLVDSLRNKLKTAVVVLASTDATAFPSSGA